MHCASDRSGRHVCWSVYFLHERVLSPTPLQQTLVFVLNTGDVDDCRMDANEMLIIIGLIIQQIRVYNDKNPT